MDWFVTLRYGLRLNKPRFLWRVLTGYLRAGQIRPVPLKYVDFAFDYRCNLRCQHCFATALHSRRPKLSLEEYRTIARECERMGVLHVSFQGGEPLLLPRELESIIGAFGADRFYIAITTNGTMLTPERLTWLKRIGVDKITVSLDSMTPGVHDAFRGVPGTFAKAMAGIEHALGKGFRVTINTTLTHQNLHSEGTAKIFEFSRQRRVIVNPIFAAPAGRWTGTTKFMLTPDDVAYVTALQKENPYLRRDLDSNYFGRGCPAVKEVLYVSPTGDVLPCPFLHISLGNLHDEPLSVIRARGLAYPPFAAYSPQCYAAEIRPFTRRILAASKKTGKMPVPLAALT